MQLHLGPNLHQHLHLELHLGLDQARTRGGCNLVDGFVREAGLH